MKRRAKARWAGTLQGGHGELTTESGALSEASYSFRTRFGEDRGTNPEELLAAAHAGCYSMSLAWLLGQGGMAAERIETAAALTLENGPGGPEVTGIHLTVVARVPGADEERFRERAREAERRCLVSRLLAVEVTLDAALEPAPPERADRPPA